MTTTAAIDTDTTTIDWIERAHRVGTACSATVADDDRRGELNTAAFDRLRVDGLTAALVPAEHGGGGATHADTGEMLRALARHDPATAVTLAMHTHLVAAQVWRHKHGMDATPFFRKIVDGPAIAISTGASDWVASNGVARAVDGGYRVSARKAPASGCEIGDLLVTSIRWDGGPEGPQVIHCAIPFTADGVSVDKTWDTLGLRATGSHTVVLDDVFVPEAAVSLIRPADVWHPVWNTVIGAAMPLVMAAYVGMADAAVECALTMVAGRAEPHTLQLAGEMVNAHLAVLALVKAMFDDADDLRFDNTDAIASRTLSRKTVAADALIQCVRLAIETVGGVGYTRGTELERLYRDVHGCLFHPLPRAKQTRFSGRVAVGLTPVG
ncbi:MAG TPA: acyl-CoA dehydrogenase family protein [Acidimicrobiia bacterium]|jgi:acyl-CoA dehydrogenase